MQDAYLAAAEPYRDLVGKRDRGPGQTGNALDEAKQPREAADLGIHIRLAALGDQSARRRRGQYFRAGIGGSAEHPHGVIVREQQIFDRLVGDLGDPLDDLPCHHRRGLGVDHHHAVVADNDPGIGIAFGGEGIKVGPDGVEGNRLVGQIGGRGKIRAHRLFLPETLCIT